MDRLDTPSLESAIRDEAGRAIADIARRQAEEIRRIDAAHAAELEDFRKRTAALMDAKIRQESARMRSRALLDLRKNRLKSFEAFIDRMVGQVAEGIRARPRYRRFLLDSVLDAAGSIPGLAQVRLASGDLAFEKEIREAARKAGSGDVAVVEDGTIRWGGCIVVDASGGRVFDATLERIRSRKSQSIRREVARLLGMSPREAE